MCTSLVRRVSRNLLVVLATGVLFAACNKEKPTIARITVVDENGTIVPLAYVRLFADPSIPLGDPTRLDMEMYTDSRGVAEFDYSDLYKQGQAGFAVLDILATKDTLAGEGIIKILEEEENEEKVTLVPVTP